MAATAILHPAAQTFVVDPASNTSFEMVSPNPSSASSPSRSPLSPSRRAQRTPQRGGGGMKPSPSPKRRTPRGVDARSPDDVHSWSDATLASKYHVGYGNWGSVWKVCAKVDNPEQMSSSVKLVHRSKNPTSSARVRALWTEYKCIRALRGSPHPNIIDFTQFIITPSYAIVTMSYHQRLMPVALPESKAKTYFRQLLSAVDHLHSHGISHNDIKPSNILLSADDRPILIDFGFAQHYSLMKSDRFLSSLSWGTPEYLSPERAKGQLHDERLSDVWALGVTMYEIVVGRTPFEQTEDESFLNREQLEVYYHRTVTGAFFGDFIISSDFQSLIHLMVEPVVHLRMQTCGKALRHRFFDPPASPFSVQSVSYTPTRTALGKAASLVQTPSSASKKPSSGGAKVKTPKSHDRGKRFAIYEDAEVPSPVRSGDEKSPFSPRRDLENRKTPSPAPAPLVPTTPKPFTLGLKKTPPPSKIPVRKGDIGSPVPLVAKSPTRSAFLGHRRLVSSPSIPSHATKKPTPPPVPPLPHSVVTASSALTRSSSFKPIKRKPPPALEDELACVQTLAKTKPTLATGEAEGGHEEEEEEALASGRTSPVSSAHCTSTSNSVPTTPSEPTFTSRSYTIKITRQSKLPGADSLASFSNLGEVFSTDISRLGRKSSSAVASRFRKLSVKNVRRAPSAMSFSGLKSFVGKRRASLADSMYDMVDAETGEQHNSVTMPLDFGSSAGGHQIHRARLESFSRHIGEILEARKVVDPPETVQTVSPTTTTSKPGSPKKPVAVMQPVRELSREPSPEPFSYNGTRSLSPSSLLDSSTFSPPPRKSSFRRFSPKKSAEVLASPPTSPTSSTTSTSFKPGHRRIPTAIRSVPSVVLYESADDGDYSESDYSRADTPFDRVASPPPPPRVVEAARQLPQWVPADMSDSDSEQEADVDEPTVTISTPSRLKRMPSHASSNGRNATPKASPIKRQQQHSPSRPPLIRGNTAVSSLNSSSTRPPSPAFATLPFSNFDLRAASRASTNTSSVASSPPRKKLGHKRSRSVLSFFFGEKSATESAAGTGTDRSRSVSRMSNTSSLGWSTTGEALPKLDVGREAGRKKKGGRLRKAVSRLFS
ncbi:hypothetical protein JCM8097_003927 [Rhodosporidiobolus ruineniae]